MRQRSARRLTAALAVGLVVVRTRRVFLEGDQVRPPHRERRGVRGRGQEQGGAARAAQRAADRPEERGSQLPDRRALRQGEQARRRVVLLPGGDAPRSDTDGRRARGSQADPVRRYGARRRAGEPGDRARTEQCDGLHASLGDRAGPREVRGRAPGGVDRDGARAEGRDGLDAARDRTPGAHPRALDQGPAGPGFALPGSREGVQAHRHDLPGRPQGPRRARTPLRHLAGPRGRGGGSLPRRGGGGDEAPPPRARGRCSDQLRARRRQPGVPALGHRAAGRGDARRPRGLEQSRRTRGEAGEGQRRSCLQAAAREQVRTTSQRTCGTPASSSARSASRKPMHT